jgi:uncharacterized protein (TIGR00369 family)
VEELSADRAALLSDDFHQGFVKNCGIRLVAMQRGRAESVLEVTPAHTQQDGFVHAGVIATMADHTAGYAAFSVVDEERRILTMEFNINYLRPALGPGLVCRSRLLKEGRQVLVAESEVYDLRDGREKLAAKAMVTLMAVQAGRIMPSPERK